MLNQRALRKDPTVSAGTDSEPHHLKAYLKATKLMWVQRVVSHPCRRTPGSPASNPFHNPLPRSPIAGVTEMDG
eukprot:471907-Pelagomonas_calceolata.AAC.1